MLLMDFMSTVEAKIFFSQRIKLLVTYLLVTVTISSYTSRGSHLHEINPTLDTTELRKLHSFNWTKCGCSD